MAFGEGKHHPLRIMRAALRDARRGSRAKAKLAVIVTVDRDVHPSSGRGQFKASACVARRAADPIDRGWARETRARSARCGKVARGASPTKATKAALHALASRL